MTRVLVAIFLLVACCLAQMRNMAVDESSAMKNVHKVAVFINLGPTSPAPYQPNFERVKKQIGDKLNKFDLELVADATNADLVLVATEYNVNTGATASAYSTGATTTAVATDRICLADEIRVFKGGRTPSADDAPIWSANESCGFSWPLNRAMDKFRKVIRK